MEYTNIFCIRLDFGVPLEDIFPPHDIHPRLHNLFYQTRIALRENPYPLFRIIKTFESHSDSGSELKEVLLRGNLRYKQDIPLVRFFWLMRHFLGLLPLPLFTKYSDGQCFNWEYLANQCHTYKMQQCHHLDLEISWSIHRLPKAHIMLIYTFISFLRKISMKPNSDKLDKRSVVAVVNYFTSALFLRPYGPKTNKNYCSLLFYIVVHWSKIKKHKSERCTSKLLPIWEDEEPSSGRIKNKLIDSSCQTSSALLMTTERQVFSQEVQVSEDLIKPQKLEENKLPDNHIYEEILDEDKTNSETVIYKKDVRLTPKILLKEKLSKANRSVVSVIGKLKSKQELIKSKSGSKLTYKYNLLKDPKATKVHSLHVNTCVKESPNIKYKKLMTL